MIDVIYVFQEGFGQSLERLQGKQDSYYDVVSSRVNI